MSERAESKEALAAEVWRLMFGYFMSTRDQREAILHRLNLTPNDARALTTLSREGRTMRSLAEEWGCDASNATWIVDRLESRNLAERRALPSDRRVKLVVLTPEGEKMRANLIDSMNQPPPGISNLDQADLETLARYLAKLPFAEA